MSDESEFSVGFRLNVYEWIYNSGDYDGGNQHASYIDVDTDGRISFTGDSSNYDNTIDTSFCQMEMPPEIAREIADFITFALKRIKRLGNQNPASVAEPKPLPKGPAEAAGGEGK